MPLLQLRQIKKYNTKNIRLAGEDWDEEWKTLIAIMMSAQTRDATTIKICNILFDKYKTLKDLSLANIKEIEKEINSINYFKTKARHILETSKIILNNGIPDNIDELVKLPGVGRKTANVFLSETGKTPAIGVDTHVYRISHKLGWSNSKSIKKTELDLKKLFPKRYWNDINNTLVKFGQTHNPKEENYILSKIQNIKI